MEALRLTISQSRLIMRSWLPMCWAWRFGCGPN